MMLRILLAVAVLVSAAVHLFMWFDYARGDDVLGPGFLLNAAGGAGIALLLVAWRHWVPVLLAVGFGLSTLGAFVLATTVGFLGTTATWDGWEVWTAAVAELVAVLVGLLVLRGHGPWSSDGELQHDPTVGQSHLH